MDEHYPPAADRVAPGSIAGLNRLFKGNGLDTVRNSTQTHRMLRMTHTFGIRRLHPPAAEIRPPGRPQQTALGGLFHARITPEVPESKAFRETSARRIVVTHSQPAAPAQAASGVIALHSLKLKGPVAPHSTPRKPTGRHGSVTSPGTPNPGPMSRPSSSEPGTDLCGAGPSSRAVVNRPTVVPNCNRRHLWKLLPAWIRIFHHVAGVTFRGYRSNLRYVA